MARRRDYAAEYRRRQERARAEGYRSYWAKRTDLRQVRGPRDLRELSVAEQEARARALETVSRMRSHDLSLTEAARQAATTPATVRRWAGASLVSEGRRVRVRPGDRLYRRMRVVGWDGPVVVDVRGSRVASLVGRHWDALGWYLSTGDASRLEDLRGARVGGIEVLTDLQRIKELARAGEPHSFESIYAQVA